MLTDDRGESALSHALSLARAGYFVAPVTIRRNPATGRKMPVYHGQWGIISTADESRILSWAAEHGPDLSFCIDCDRSGSVAVDLDVKVGGVDAVIEWSANSMPIGDMVVDTPSGGMHHYWRARADAPVHNSQGKIAPGVDIRGIGGHVYAPGSRVVGEAVPYVLRGPIIPPSALAPLPDEILLAIPERERTRARSSREPRANGARHDRRWVQAEATRQLDRVRACPATLGTGFRAVLMGAAMVWGRAVAGGLISRADAEAYLIDATASVWGRADDDDEKWIMDGLDDGEADPWSIADTVDPVLAPVPAPTPPPTPAPAPVQESNVLTPIVQESGSTQRDMPWPAPPAAFGNVEPARTAEEIEAAVRAEVVRLEAEKLAEDVARERRKRKARRLVDEEERPPAPPIAELAVWDDELESIPPPAMAVPELIPEQGVGWLGGPSGSYKSFVAIQVAMGLAYGSAVLGDVTFAPRRARKVLYVAGEGASGVALRSRAAKRRAGILRARQFALYPRAVDLASETDMARLEAFVLANEIEFVVIDTFRQSTLGVNENDNTEVGVVVGRLLRLRDDHGIGSMLVDHTAKTAQGLADLGGAGAKRANTDYVLMIDLPNGDRSAGQQRVLRVAKLKDGEDGRTWPIRLESVPEVTDAEGRPSAVAVIGETAPSSVDIHSDDDWREAAVPADVTDWRGQGRDDLPLVAQLMITFGSGESGLTREELLKHYRSVRSGLTAATSLKRAQRAWDALHALGRLESVSPSGTSPTGRHRWVKKDPPKINN